MGAEIHRRANSSNRIQPIRFFHTKAPIALEFNNVNLPIENWVASYSSITIDNAPIDFHEAYLSGHSIRFDVRFDLFACSCFSRFYVPLALVCFFPSFFVVLRSFPPSFSIVLLHSSPSSFSIFLLHRSFSIGSLSPLLEQIKPASLKTLWIWPKLLDRWPAYLNSERGREYHSNSLHFRPKTVCIKINLFVSARPFAYAPAVGSSLAREPTECAALCARRRIVSAVWNYVPNVPNADRRYRTAGSLATMVAVKNGTSNRLSSGWYKNL